MPRPSKGPDTTFRLPVNLYCTDRALRSTASCKGIFTPNTRACSTGPRSAAGVDLRWSNFAERCGLTRLWGDDLIILPSLGYGEYTASESCRNRLGSYSTAVSSKPNCSILWRQSLPSSSSPRHLSREWGLLSHRWHPSCRLPGWIRPRSLPSQQ